MASVVFAEETMLSVSFSLTKAVELASRRVAVAGLAVLETSTFVLTSVRGSDGTASVSLAAVATGASVAAVA